MNRRKWPFVRVSRYVIGRGEFFAGRGWSCFRCCFQVRVTGMNYEEDGDAKGGLIGVAFHVYQRSIKRSQTFLIYKWRIIFDFIFFLNYSVYILK